MALPWLGIGLGVVGGWKLSRSDPEGWWLLGAGAALLIADVVIDFVWAHPTVSKSDQPDLNRPAAQLVGRVLIVVEGIEGGRGKSASATRCGPSRADAPAGAQVRVTAARARCWLWSAPDTTCHPRNSRSRIRDQRQASRLRLGPGYFADAKFRDDMQTRL
jgi:membrane protein implicated in regulation of membrane protease activity